ncbi:MAG: hypothetical protein A3B25_03970 [Candidatus Ryanbacteria bacterium RIFCSPLOWO2_01_FULL_48_26]|uniref:Uncharacterized protein n=1 Tax=Candidatus Ryanbacteria bacterium RIFCSPLOWO2_01_FULL_48_26 TaxID=1802126 RepID=A0A1G2GQU3_9BACT|nr:MAG: hypothetical protein A3B25_03970 [Candidatus Ryanbacteria bacterium RIFCSPLOWO2_01_FULL_48_26]
MFPKKSRLPGPEMGRIFSKTFSSTHFLLKSRENTGNNNRFAIIISNQAVPKSTRRHFFKRFFANQLKTWPNAGKDCIIIASPRLESATRETLISEISAARGILFKKDGTII